MGNRSCTGGVGKPPVEDARELVPQFGNESHLEKLTTMPKDPKCTDLVCLLVFLGFLFGMGWITMYALNNGDPQRLSRGIDWQGNMCGLTNVTEGKPYLFWCGEGNMISDMPSDVNTEFPICVTQCPSDTTGSVDCPQKPNTKESVKEEGGDIISTLTITQETKQQSTYPTYTLAHSYCIPEGANLDLADALRERLLAGSADGSLENVYEELGDLWHASNLSLFGGMIAGAFVMGYIYLIFVRYFAKILVYVTLVSCVIVLMLVGASFLITGLYPDSFLELKYNLASSLWELLDSQTAQVTSCVIGGVSLVIGLLCSILICCAKEAIDTAVACLAVAVSAIFSTPGLLIQPLVAALMKAATLILLLCGLMFLISCGDVESRTVNLGSYTITGMHRSLTYTKDEQSLLLYYCFGIVWIMEMCNAIETFVVAHVVVIWYFTEKNALGMKRMLAFPVIRGFGICMFFHLGTMAAGSFLIALTRVVQFVLWLIVRQVDSEDDKASQCVKYIAEACICCVECFKNCLEVINKNAYIHVAIFSKDFMVSAMEAFNFAKSWAVTIMVLNGATFVAQAAGFLSITCVGAFASWAVVEHWSESLPESSMTNPVMAAAVAGVICASIATVFMSLLDDVSDTLLYVYACHTENANLGSQSDYAPDDLVKLINKYGAPRSGQVF